MLVTLATPALAAESDTEAITPQSMPFTDVPSWAWYFDYVQTVYARSVMNGISTTRFAPQDTFTRAQVLTALFRVYHGRLSDENDPRNNNFADVSAGWYAPYVTWAANNGVTPTTSGNFAPNRAATRQEITLFVHRYVMNLADLNSGSTANAQWNAFPDRGQIGSAYYYALRGANNHGIVRGIPVDGVARIVPQGTTNRAEAATMLVRLMGLLPAPDIDALTRNGANFNQLLEAGFSRRDIQEAFEREVIRLVNLERANYGLAPFTLNTQLSVIAQGRATSMIRYDYFSHTDHTTGLYGWDHAWAMGWTGFATENAHMGAATPQGMVTSQMNSPGHRLVMLAGHPQSQWGADMTQVGVGFDFADGMYPRWTFWISTPPQ